jgi:Mrp family chromosome partitioning ATPase
VLLDAGALDTASATSWLLAAIAGHVDAAILVSNSADGEKYLSAAARQSLANWGMDLVGVVTNFVSRHN